MKWNKTKIVSVVLASIYGILMLISAIVLRGNLPIWLLILNLAASIILLLSIKWEACLFIGLVAFLPISILNGQALSGQNNGLHLLIRLLFSIGLIVLYKLPGKKE